MEMRAHQRKMNVIAGEIVAGAFPRKRIVLDCTPGGGKTGSATLLATKLLDAGIIQGVLWVVPRISLAEQVVDAFSRGFGGNPSYCLTEATPERSLFPDVLDMLPREVGHVTTYQALAKARTERRFLAALHARKILLVFDEVQFLSDTLGCRGIRSQKLVNKWLASAERLEAKAKYTLLMSGTLWRTDNKQIPFIKYERHEDGLYYPFVDIRYTLRDAIREMAVLPIEWHNHGGQVRYTHNGTSQVHELIDCSTEEDSRKVRAFLADDEACKGILDRMVADWRDWRRTKYPSRMIVMAADQDAARRWKEHMEKQHGIPCVLATSSEGAKGRRRLRQFRDEKRWHCLVTVAMAYVGFDCPDLTHLAYLSHIRAFSWMMQAIGRCSRVDHANAALVPAQHQHAFVYSLDDEQNRKFCSAVRLSSRLGIADRPPDQRPARDEFAERVLGPVDDFEPVSARLGALAIETARPDIGRMNPALTAKLQEFAATCPGAKGLSLTQLYDILSRANQIDIGAIVAGEKRNGQTAR